ncbi:MAG: hypothetical protein DMF62_07780 [Acidobacteria bacterium]|nr:MAG: hypothetical protein DMF62_07780 [Acidobacteriota bacterium]
MKRSKLSISESNVWAVIPARILAICFVFGLLAAGTRLFSVSTVFDQNFAYGVGYRIDSFSSKYDVCRASVVQPDGKIVLVGEVAEIRFGIMRLNVDGSPDLSFNSTGRAFTQTGPLSIGEATAVSLQTDGKIVVAGGANGHLVVARFNSNGSLDTGFDGIGYVESFGIGGGPVEDYAMAIQSDGKIIAGGTTLSGLGDFGVVRFNSNGTPDNSFNGTGQVITSIGTSSDDLKSITIQNDGKIIAGGTTFENDTVYYSAVLVRYNTNGSLDTTFNGTGISINRIDGASWDVFSRSQVKVQSNGGIVFAGGVASSPWYKMAILRLNSNGTLDTSFNSTGKLVMSFGSFDSGLNALALQSDGKLVAAGWSDGNESGGVEYSLAILLRLNTNGTLDSSFHGNGITTVKDGLGSFANSVSIQPNGKILVAGSSFNDVHGDNDFGVFRFEVNGSLDPSLDHDAKLSIDVSSYGSQGQAVRMQPDGKIVAAGSTFNMATGSLNSVSNDFAVSRLNSDGSMDSSFRGNSALNQGKVSTDFSGGDDAAYGLAIQSDSKIVVAGSASNGSNLDFALVRYNIDGSLDSTFNGNGKVLTSVRSSTDIAYSVVIQSDGKIVTGGVSFGGAHYDFAFARYNADGTVDSTFGVNGIDIVPVTAAGVESVLALTTQPDGKIVAAGTAKNGTNDDFTVVRLNPNGTLDNTFNGNGKIVTPVLSGDDQGLAVGLQSDGKIVVAGGTFNGSDYDYAIVRYNTNGTLDTTLNGTGIVTTPVRFGNDFANSVVIQLDGRIIASGTSDTGTGFDFSAVRYNADGTLDPSFNDTGKATFDLDGNDVGFGSAIDGSGNLLMVGQSANLFAIARFRTRPKSMFDYDGDGKSDISVWRPSDGVWYIIQSGSSSVRAQGWGLNGDSLTPADFDGDGKTDLAVFRPSDSNWYIVNSETNTVTVAGWGLAGDLPVPADYGGDGKADLAVYRPSEGKWYRRDSDGKLHTYSWGLQGDKPAPADFNGDGVADMTVFRPSEGKWYTINSGNASISEFTWGLNGDIPIPGDYSGDGKSDFAVFRPSNQTWYRIHSDTFQIHIITWGLPGDFPTPGDYDGDGKQDLAVFRPSNSTWFINSSTGGIYSQPFGLAGDIPVENAFVY